jgi:hypothetical protein
MATWPLGAACVAAAAVQAGPTGYCNNYRSHESDRYAFGLSKAGLCIQTSRYAKRKTVGITSLMRKKRAVLLAVILAIASPAFSDAGGLKNIEDELISKIRAKLTPLYKKYIGVESTREIVSKQYDSRNDTYRGGYTVLLRRKEYFYKRATYKVIKYLKDDKEQPSWTYNYPTRKPAYQPFDPDTDKNYTITLLGKKIIKNIPCWEFDITPKKKTSRHIIGNVYFTIKELDLFFMKGTVADYPYGLKNLYLEIYFKKLEDAYIMSNGTYTFVVDIPIFYPHKKFIQAFNSYDDVMIPVKTKK